MAKALKCDKCGQFYDRLSKPRKYLIQDSERFIYLCPDCYEHFIKWLSNENEKEETK